MMDANTILQTSEREYLDFLVNSRLFLDYGVVTKVTSDTHVDVVHAGIEVLLDDTRLPETRTPDVELLWPSMGGLSVKGTVKIGDKVLLVGLKTYVPNVEELKGAAVPAAFEHYSRATMKAIPLGAFNASSSAKIQASDTELKIDAPKVELNGATKQFVTWTELNTALQALITALNLHTHPTALPGPPSPPTPVSLDISAAKTTTVLTGG
jgi:hypothetical protein